MFGVNISGKNNPHPSVIPAELCEVIPGQLYKRKVPEYHDQEAQALTFIGLLFTAPQRKGSSILGVWTSTRLL
jgi:hypothetical protein